ncbi:MAG: hypothetical protein C5B53_06870 [Candidatus Melainabacteria bacterium]|nr:MAG: hypothetical protein C5B53_06870 [Candidatus Melainabacteria bacterium]
MSLADDHASPATPFYGDKTGEIFDAPDLVLQSPTTTERVVDTQSGFLVVVRRLGSRSSLSVKRRLGTPPVSSILLTPDETLKLSRILAGSELGADDAKESKTTPVSSDLNEWNSRFSSNALEKDSEEKSEEEAKKNGTTKSDTKPRAFSQFVSSRSAQSRLLDNRATLLSLVFIVALGTGIALASHWRARQHKKVAVQQTKPIEPKGPSDQDIDKFVRGYVSNMLDFSPDTYKNSQIQAMSAMAPQLMAKYWQETNFPISAKQLKNSLKRETLVITKVVQQANAADKSSRLVDVFAQLNSSDGKSSIPTHLQLKLALDPPNEVKVVEQNDVTASDKTDKSEKADKIEP